MDSCRIYLLVAVAISSLGAMSSCFFAKRASAAVFAFLLALFGFFCLIAALTSWNHSLVFACPYPLYLGVAPMQFRFDSLASVFLGLLAVVAFAVAPYSPPYLRHLQARINPSFYWFSLFTFVASMALVILAANAVTFLFFWETMSLSSAALVASDSQCSNAHRAAIIYLGATRIATALLAGGFLWLYWQFGSWNFSDWQVSAARASLPFLLVLIGLMIKAGAWPFHIWLPYAHPAAPSPVSALMSGVMIKVAIYAILRLFLVAGDAPPPLFFAYITLLIGSVSAFWGVLFALVQRDMKRLLAYSSVENIGIILVALGVSFYSLSRSLPLCAALGISAAIFHCVNHGMFKSLLFLGAGSIDYAAHTRELGKLGGLARVMPYTMLFFLLATLAICALPPTNGFASKWLVYQGLFQISLACHERADVIVMFGSMAVLALVGALAVGTFVKLFGVAFLGRPRTRQAERAKECPVSMQVSLLGLSLICILLGLGAPQFAGLVLEPITFAATRQRLMPAGSFLPMLPFGAMLFGSAFLVATLYLFNQSAKTRFYNTWDCGFGRPTARMQVNADSFAHPIASIFKVILQYHMIFEISGRDRRHFPERIKADTKMVSLLESRVYSPVIESVRWLSRHMASLQAGSIHIYLLYILVALVTLLVFGARV